MKRFFLILISVVCATSALAQDTITVRAGRHADKSRLVFDWTEKPGFKLETEATGVTVIFDRDGTVDLSNVRQVSPANVENPRQVSDSPLTVRFDTPQPRTLKTFYLGPKLVLDVVDAESPSTETVKPPPSPPAVPATSVAVEAVKPPEATLTQPPARMEPIPPEDSAQPVPSESVPEHTSTIVLEDQTTNLPPAALTTPSVIRLSPSLPVRVAVFAYGTSLWIVSDENTGNAPPRLTGPLADVITKTERNTIGSGVAFRFDLPRQLDVTVKQEGFQWDVILTARQDRRSPPAFTVDGFAHSDGQFDIAVQNAAQPLYLQETVTGDRLHIIPVTKAGLGVSRYRRYADFELVPTAQGVVLRSLRDAVSVQTDANGITITADKGLNISPVIPEPPVTGQKTGITGKREAFLFDFKTWTGGDIADYEKNRQELEHQIVEQPTDNRIRRLLDFARFQVANGYGVEARGLMGLMMEREPDLAQSPDFIGLRGAAHALSYNAEDAVRDLTLPVISEIPEIKLWLGLVAADANRWSAAYDLFGEDTSILYDYPPTLYARFALRVAEAALRAGDSDMAKYNIERLQERAEDRSLTNAEKAGLNYLEGELYRQKNEMDKARESWEKAATSNDQYYRVKSELALVIAGQQDGSITLDEAVQRLDQLRFAWRGDDLELAVLRTLADYYLKNNQYREGLNTYKMVASLETDPARVDAVTDLMVRTFVSLFSPDMREKLSPLQALALYDEFQELAPSGPEGDMIIKRLADRLVEIDLLEKASDLLESLIADRLTGVDKALTGSRLAAIELFNDRPLMALKALDDSEIVSIPASLERERNLFRARALSLTGRVEEALVLLSGDQSLEAQRLRTDIFWREERWAEAAQTLGRLAYDGDNTPTPEKVDLVMNLAVALSLADDARGLAYLRDTYGEMMTQTLEGDAFDVLTNPGADLTFIDRDLILSRVNTVNVFQQFLEGYRQNIAGGS